MELMTGNSARAPRARINAAKAANAWRIVCVFINGLLFDDWLSQGGVETGVGIGTKVFNKPEAVPAVTVRLNPSEVVLSKGILTTRGLVPSTTVPSGWLDVPAKNVSELPLVATEESKARYALPAEASTGMPVPDTEASVEDPEVSVRPGSTCDWGVPGFAGSFAPGCKSTKS